MNKQDFIADLRKKLSGLPSGEVEERIGFYAEMIDDRIEDGRTEEEAVAELGSTDEIAEQILSEIPLVKIAKERVKPSRRLRTWEIVLLALGSPIWLSLAVAAFAVVLSLYAVLWSLVVSLWSVFASLVASALGGAVAGAILTLFEHPVSGIAVIGAGLICAGLAIFLFFGCKAATVGAVRLTKQIALTIKKCFIKKEAAR